VSRVQVISLLKAHNRQLCLSSKDYADLVRAVSVGAFSPHRRSKSPIGCPTATPVRSTSRHSPTKVEQHRVQSAHHTSSRMQRLRREFATLEYKHSQLTDSRARRDETINVVRQMQVILDELERLQQQEKKRSREHTEQNVVESPLNMLRRAQVLQLILKDAIANERHC
jgi:hypothetical protein